MLFALLPALIAPRPQPAPAPVDRGRGLTLVRSRKRGGRCANVTGFRERVRAQAVEERQASTTG